MTSLRNRAAAGAKWTGLSSGVILLCSLLQLALLGRWLTQADFGLMSMTVTIVGFAYLYADAGFANAIIYRQHSSSFALSSLFWTNIALGLVLAACLWLLSPFVASFYRESAVKGLLHLAALVLVVVAVGQVSQALMQRDLGFRSIALIDVAAATGGLAVALAAAWFGQGARSFIWGQLATAGIRAVASLLSVRKQWSPSLHFALADLKGYASFGAYQLGERSANYWAANLDYLLVGRVLGSMSLGIYTVAYQLAVVPMQRLNPILTRVAFPILARKQNNAEQLTRAYLELVKAVAFMSFPLLAGLALCAPVAVPLVVGSQWLDAVVLVQVLCAMSALKLIGNTTGSLLLAHGRADVGFWWNVLASGLTAVTLILAVSHGIIAVAVAQAALSLVLTGIMLFVLKRKAHLPLGSFFASIAAPLLTTAAMAAVVALVLAITDYANAPDLAILAASVAGGALSYGLAWRLLNRGYISSMWRLTVGSRNGTP